MSAIDGTISMRGRRRAVKAAKGSAIRPPVELRREVVSDRRANHRANAGYERTLILKLASGGAKLRLVLHRDNSYDFQSYARVSVWNGTEWSTIDTIPGPTLNRQPNDAAIIDDLIAVAQAVLA